MNHRESSSYGSGLLTATVLMGLTLLGIGCSDGGGESPGAADRPPANFAGIWDARFAGGSIGTEIDALELGVLTLSQTGATATGTLEFEGLPTAPAGGIVNVQVLSFTAVTTLADGRDLRVVATGTLISENVWSGSFSMTLAAVASRGLFEATRR